MASGFELGYLVEKLFSISHHHRLDQEQSRQGHEICRNKTSLIAIWR